MDDVPPPPATTGDPTTTDGADYFDKADYVDQPGPAACAVCQLPISEAYFQINDKTTCTNCRDAVLRAVTGGSGLWRFCRAIFFGGLGAIAGAAIWMMIAKLTGLEIGLVAVVVGVIVGLGVRKGSDARGGWLYQCLAVFLTYTAIISTYVPGLVQGFAQAAKNARDKEMAAPDVERAPVAEPVTQTPTWLAAIILAAIIIAFAYAVPFMAGLQNIVGLLIIAFALFEAWRINKRPTLHVAGPFQLSFPPSPRVIGPSAGEA